MFSFSPATSLYRQDATEIPERLVYITLKPPIGECSQIFRPLFLRYSRAAHPAAGPDLWRDNH